MEFLDQNSAKLFIITETVYKLKERTSVTFGINRVNARDRVSFDFAFSGIKIIRGDAKFGPFQIGAFDAFIFLVTRCD